MGLVKSFSACISGYKQEIRKPEQKINNPKVEFQNRSNS